MNKGKFWEKKERLYKGSQKAAESNRYKRKEDPRNIFLKKKKSFFLTKYNTLVFFVVKYFLLMTKG
jgi:hypothetical protein